MKSKIGFGSAILVLVATLFGVAGPAAAKTRKVTHYSPDDLKRFCDNFGGTYSPPSAKGVYCCLLTWGLVCCGGTTNDCTETTRVRPQDSLVPKAGTGGVIAPPANVPPGAVTSPGGPAPAAR